MKVVETIREMRRARVELPAPVAMMATLGGLHAGHEALLAHARKVGASLVASLFLNPTQFEDRADLERYPTDRDRDLDIFASHGVDVVFAPSVEEMYPVPRGVTVDPGPVAARLEGEHRPGHFRGVATVVAKILSVIGPHIAVWGAKDAQQNVVIRAVTRDLLMDVEHRIVPTVREDDGLALSSRNAYLTAEQRRAAPVLYAGLRQALARWKEGATDAGALADAVRSTVGLEPLVELEYISVADAETLDELEVAVPGALVSLAARVGVARLIDNVTLG